MGRCANPCIPCSSRNHQGRMCSVRTKRNTRYFVLHSAIRTWPRRRPLSPPRGGAFDRRPGSFAVVIDCISGTATANLHAPFRRHFYVHGAFSSGGGWQFTTENDHEAGRVGVRDTAAGSTRIAAFDNGGIGPHDIKRLPHTEPLVIANGWIDATPTWAGLSRTSQQCSRRSASFRTRRLLRPPSCFSSVMKTPSFIWQ